MQGQDFSRAEKPQNQRWALASAAFLFCDFMQPVQLLQQLGKRLQPNSQTMDNYSSSFHLQIQPIVLILDRRERPQRDRARRRSSLRQSVDPAVTCVAPIKSFLLTIVGTVPHSKQSHRPVHRRHQSSDAVHRLPQAQSAYRTQSRSDRRSSTCDAVAQTCPAPALPQPASHSPATAVFGPAHAGMRR